MHLDITSIVQHRPKCTPVRLIYGPTVLFCSLGKIWIVRAAMSLNIVDWGKNNITCGINAVLCFL